MFRFPMMTGMILNTSLVRYDESPIQLRLVRQDLTETHTKTTIKNYTLVVEFPQNNRVQGWGTSELQLLVSITYSSYLYIHYIL